MNVKIHYRITQDRAGIPQDYTGARHFAASSDNLVVAETARLQLAADYQIPISAVEIFRIEE